VTLREPIAWLVTAAAVSAAALAFWGARGGTASAGSRASFDVTVVASDAQSLDCSSSADFGGIRCAFGADGVPRKVDLPLRPYVTFYREVVLLSGLFEEQHVAAWLREAMRTADPERVSLRCSGEVLGRAPTVGVRWRPGSAFDPLADVLAGSVRECRFEK